MFKILGADQKEYGPVTSDQLRQWIAEGRVNAQTRVLLEGTTDWKPLAEFFEFAKVLKAASPAAMIPPLAPPSPPKTNRMAIAGLTMGICTIVLGCCCYGLPFNVLGIIFSSVALNQIKQQPDVQHGREMAFAGLILSILSIVLVVVLVIIGASVNLEDITRQLRKR
jgi:hypothetical protein